MSEVKGTLLTIILALGVFAAVFGLISGVIQDKADDVADQIRDAGTTETVAVLRSGSTLNYHY